MVVVIRVGNGFDHYMQHLHYMGEIAVTAIAVEIHYSGNGKTDPVTRCLCKCRLAKKTLSFSLHERLLPTPKPLADTNDIASHRQSLQ